MANLRRHRDALGDMLAVLCHCGRRERWFTRAEVRAGECGWACDRFCSYPESPV